MVYESLESKSCGTTNSTVVSSFGYSAGGYLSAVFFTTDSDGVCSITEWTVTTGETIVADFSSASPAPECEEIAPFDDTDSPTPSPSGTAAILTSTFFAIVSYTFVGYYATATF
jgi:hypothetical protein